MTQYIIRRLLISIGVLLGVTVFVFVLINLMPGDPIDFMIPQDSSLSEEAVTAMRVRLGLDKPAPVRYFTWLKETLRGNLGYRFKNFDPVGPTLARRIGPTLLLAGAALFLGVVVGVPLGIFSATYKYSFFDVLCTSIAFLGISLPAFFAGLVGLYLFSLRWQIFPAGGMTSVVSGGSFRDIMHHLTLPAIILSLNYSALMLRYTRSSMLEVMTQDYVRTARAKGLTETSLLTRHALRNALIPIITVLGLSVPSLVGGAVFIESIFSWPGMGTLFLDAITSRDYPMIMAMTLVIAATILLVNILVDVFYAAANPRIRYD